MDFCNDTKVYWTLGEEHVNCYFMMVEQTVLLAFMCKDREQ